MKVLQIVLRVAINVVKRIKQDIKEADQVGSFALLGNMTSFGNYDAHVPGLGLRDPSLCSGWVSQLSGAEWKKAAGQRKRPDTYFSVCEAAEQRKRPHHPASAPLSLRFMADASASYLYGGRLALDSWWDPSNDAVWEFRNYV